MMVIIRGEDREGGDGIGEGADKGKGWGGDGGDNGGHKEV